MVIQPAQAPAVALPSEPPRPPTQTAAEDVARPVVPATPTDAATRQTRDRQQVEEKRGEDRRREAERTRASGEDNELSEDERRQVEELKARDREVRQHEAAHRAAAGRYARGGARFDYQTGPDGKHYAVGGEVNIDTGRTGDPRADLEKAQTVERAALAPTEPSTQDRSVAARARGMALEARQALAEQGRKGNTPATSRPADLDRIFGRNGEGPRPAAIGHNLDLFA
ncbi:putative metalloprotease CJM1_0395 family protein [Thiohalobacter sp.]|uniref:putative metalloprotease CJM1_0395 family protein n=1 Tax=Thiohalobacter sp. TaxID=2025948 RepID=UPI00262F53B7|nr:putative metalloprotease CJM1_0395 family protein [Thiohalobacter sp.]